MKKAPLIVVLFTALLLTHCRSSKEFSDLSIQILQRLDLNEQGIMQKEATLSKPLLQVAIWTIDLFDENDPDLEILKQLNRVDVAIYTPRGRDSKPTRFDPEFHEWLHTKNYHKVLQIHDGDESIYGYLNQGKKEDGKMLVLVFTPDEWIIARCNGNVENLISMALWQDKKNRTELKEITLRH